VIDIYYHKNFCLSLTSILTHREDKKDRGRKPGAKDRESKTEGYQNEGST
jgi:hypothetical protein